ncbi:hypothetical protein NL676_004412 [Syzygium grande]|nr:hypothetical protein NL676_004412 [Syzygium grande]
MSVPRRSLRRSLESDESALSFRCAAKSTAGKVFNFFRALGDVAFAYAGHNVVFEIQASTPEKPSKGPTWRVVVAYIIVALCYFLVALIGYQIYAMPVFDMIETVLVKKLHFNRTQNTLFPCIMWLAIYKPRRFSLSWWTNWICIVIGVLLMVLVPIEGLREIILEAKIYQFYS